MKEPNQVCVCVFAIEQLKLKSNTCILAPIHLIDPLYVCLPANGSRKSTLKQTLGAVN